MKYITIIAAVMLFTSCASTRPQWNQIPTPKNSPFSIWTVVDKVEIEPGGCVFYWNRGINSFIDSCEKYNVGDTIKHQ